MVTTIHIEGIDRTGKDTIAKLLSEKTNLKWYITARSPISTYAYGIIYNRPTMTFEELQQYFENPQILLVYLYPIREEIDKRCENTNHEHVNDIDFKVFNEVVDQLKTTTKVIEVNMCHTPEQIVDEILNEVQRK